MTLFTLWSVCCWGRLHLSASGAVFYVMFNHLSLPQNNWLSLAFSQFDLPPFGSTRPLWPDCLHPTGHHVRVQLKPHRLQHSVKQLFACLNCVTSHRHFAYSISLLNVCVMTNTSSSLQDPLQDASRSQILDSSTACWFIGERAVSGPSRACRSSLKTPEKWQSNTCE